MAPATLSRFSEIHLQIGDVCYSLSKMVLGSLIYLSWNVTVEGPVVFHPSTLSHKPSRSGVNIFTAVVPIAYSTSPRGGKHRPGRGGGNTQLPGEAKRNHPWHLCLNKKHVQFSNTVNTVLFSFRCFFIFLRFIPF